MTENEKRVVELITNEVNKGQSYGDASYAVYLALINQARIVYDEHLTIHVKNKTNRV